MAATTSSVPPPPPHEFLILRSPLSLLSVTYYFFFNHLPVIIIIPLLLNFHHILLPTTSTSTTTLLLASSPKLLFLILLTTSPYPKVKVITTPVLESLVSTICCNVTGEVPQPDLFLQLRHREKDILFLWDLVRDIGHNDSGLLSVRLLNQLIISFSVLMRQGKPALEAFLKFEEVFQCVPNQDTYYFTMHALGSTRNMFHHAAWSICQKMLLDPERLLPDDGEKVCDMLSWFCFHKMRKEAYSLYLAVNEKRKRNPNWSLQLQMLIPTILVLEILTDIDIPDEVEIEEKGAKDWMCVEVVHASCRFKDFDAAKQLILKMIADCPLPPPGNAVFNIIITAYINAGGMGQAMEMVKLLESIGLYTSDVLMCGSSHSDGMEDLGRSQKAAF